MVKVGKLLVLLLVLGLVVGMTGCFKGNEASKSAAGTVSGILKTSRGEPITGAKVAIGKNSTTTNQEGGFTIKEVNPGKADLTINVNGTEFTEYDISVGEGVTNLGELIRIVFKPETDYPIKDLSGIQAFAVATYKEDQIVNNYKLVNQADGFWAGDFVLPVNTKYKLVCKEGDEDYYTIPLPNTKYLITGQEMGTDEGSYKRIRSWDGGILAYRQILSDNPVSKIEGMFTSEAEITFNDKSQTVSEFAQQLADRQVKDWHFMLEHTYKEQMKTRGLVTLANGVREEQYTIEYTGDTKISWKIKKLISFNGQTFKVSKTDGKYTIKFDLNQAVNRNYDFREMSVEDYEQVVLVGEFNDWTDDSDYNYQYQLTDGNSDNVWEITISNSAAIEELKAKAFKVVGITAEGKADYAPSGLGGEQTLDTWLEFSN